MTLALDLRTRSHLRAGDVGPSKPRGCGLRSTLNVAALAGAAVGLLHAAGAAGAPIAVQRKLAPSTYQTVPASSNYGPVAFAVTTLNVGGVVTPNNTVAVAPATGLYDITGSLVARAQASSFGTFEGSVAVNGNVVDRFYQGFGSTAHWEDVPVSTILQLNAGDVVTLETRSPSTNGTLIAPNETTVSLSSRTGSGAAVRRSMAVGNQIIPASSAYTTVSFVNTDVNVGAVVAPVGTVAVAPQAGVYSLKGALQAIAQASSGGNINGYVAVNGNVVDQFYQDFGSASHWDEIPISTTLNLNAGDDVTIKIRSTTLNGAAISGGDYSKVSLTQETLTAASVRRTMTVDQTIAAGSYVPVSFNTTAFNVGGLSTSAGTVGTATVAGLYDITGALTALSQASGGGVIDGYVAVNGISVDPFWQDFGSTGHWEEMPVSTLLQLNPGDVVSVYARSNNGNAIIAGGGYSSVSMTLVPEPTVLGLFAGTAAFLAGRRRR